MGIINGKEFIDRLNKLENEIWYDGEKLEGNISNHPAFKGILKTKSSLYDLQTKDELTNEMTYRLLENLIESDSHIFSLKPKVI